MLKVKPNTRMLERQHHNWTVRKCFEPLWILLTWKGLAYAKSATNHLHDGDGTSTHPTDLIMSTILAPISSNFVPYNSAPCTLLNSTPYTLLNSALYTLLNSAPLHPVEFCTIHCIQHPFFPFHALLEVATLHHFWEGKGFTQTACRRLVAPPPRMATHGLHHVTYMACWWPMTPDCLVVYR